MPFDGQLFDNKCINTMYVQFIFSLTNACDHDKKKIALKTHGESFLLSLVGFFVDQC